jgi:hypothetical protein
MTHPVEILSPLMMTVATLAVAARKPGIACPMLPVIGGLAGRRLTRTER